MSYAPTTYSNVFPWKDKPRKPSRAQDCTCFHTCDESGGGCSLSGRFHQHQDDPCPVHPDAEMTP